MARYGNLIGRRAVMLGAAALPITTRSFAQAGLPPLTNPPNQNHIAGKMIYATFDEECLSVSRRVDSAI